MAKSTTSPDLDDTLSGARQSGARSTADLDKRVVPLSGGGSLSLLLHDINLLNLNTEDRTFLFTVIDTLDAYARTHAPTPEAPATTTA